MYDPIVIDLRGSPLTLSDKILPLVKSSITLEIEFVINSYPKLTNCRVYSKAGGCHTWSSRTKKTNHAPSSPTHLLWVCASWSNIEYVVIISMWNIGIEQVISITGSVFLKYHAEFWMITRLVGLMVSHTCKCTYK